MTGVGTITFGGTITGLADGTRTLSFSIPLPGAIDWASSVVLQSGFNAFSIPTGATVVTIVPPSGNTIALTLKGITGDTGFLIHKTYPSCIDLDSTATTLGITAASTTTGVTQVNFY
jgi:hypothetical protein